MQATFFLFFSNGKSILKEKWMLRWKYGIYHLQIDFRLQNLLLLLIMLLYTVYLKMNTHACIQVSRYIRYTSI